MEAFYFYLIKYFLKWIVLWGTYLRGSFIPWVHEDNLSHFILLAYRFLFPDLCFLIHLESTFIYVKYERDPNSFSEPVFSALLKSQSFLHWHKKEATFIINQVLVCIGLFLSFFSLLSSLNLTIWKQAERGFCFAQLVCCVLSKWALTVSCNAGKWWGIMKWMLFLRSEEPVLSPGSTTSQSHELEQLP